MPKFVDGHNLEPDTVTATSDYTTSDVPNFVGTGIIVMINVESIDTADADETYEFKIQGKDEVSGNYYDILSTGDVAGDGATLHVLRVHPALSATANEAEADLVPDLWRMQILVGGTTPSIDFTIRAVHIR